MTEPATCSGDLVRAAWIIRSGNIAAESDLADRIEALADLLDGPVAAAERALDEIASSFEVYGAETADNPDRALAEAHTLVRDLHDAGYVIVPRSSAASEQQEPAGSDDER